MELTPNEGKNCIIEVDGVRYERLPIRTHLITAEDDILDVAEKYGSPVLTQPGDVLFITEKIVACTQGRAIPLKDIKPRKLAYWLSDKVTKTPHGIGLGMPETMEYALRECGVLDSLSQTAQNVLANLITIFLGITIASQMQAEQFLNPQTLLILALGMPLRLSCAGTSS